MAVPRFTPSSWLMYVLFFVFGILGGVGITYLITSVPVTHPTGGDIRESATTNGFTNPLLECAELPENISVGERISLQHDIERLVNVAKQTGTISEAAVYYRDLNNGPWFGINQSLTFSPASLLKVPLALWYYEKADVNPSILEEEVKFNGPPGVSIVHFPPAQTLEVGKTYTMEALIEYMLQESDNDAAMILNEYDGKDKTQDVYRDFGLNPDSAGSTDVHTYASYFRILYNASYIGRTLSDHMLEILSRSSFVQGLRAGVPSSILVAHKFGEKVIDANAPLYQLHDCGVVYAKKSPYVLCVMTQGKDFDVLANFIKEISATVYDRVK